MMYAYVHTHFSLTRHRTHRYTLHHSLHRAPLPSSSPPSRFLFLLKSSHRLLYTTQRNTENLGKLIWIPNVLSANYCMLCAPPRAINIVRIGHFLTISVSVSLILSLSPSVSVCACLWKWVSLLFALELVFQIRPERKRKSPIMEYINIWMGWTNVSR